MTIKNKILLSIALFISGGVAFATVNSLLPTRTQIQSKVFTDAQRELIELRQKLATAETKERDAFCLLVDLKHADRIELSNPKSAQRYANECPQVFPKVESTTLK